MHPRLTTARISKARTVKGSPRHSLGHVVLPRSAPSSNRAKISINRRMRLPSGLDGSFGTEVADSVPNLISGDAQWSGRPCVEQFNVKTPAHALRNVVGRPAFRSSCQHAGQYARRSRSISNNG
jgi:hypothetical protein